MITCDPFAHIPVPHRNQHFCFISEVPAPLVSDKMGKKMGENSKAVAARDRKNEKDQQQKAVKEKAMEDAKWADDDKALAKKQVN